MTQILHHPHPHLANHAKFATFAHNKAGKLRTFTNMFMHIFYMFAHILHYCRLVLDAYNFTIPTVFYIEIYVYFIQYQCF